MPQHELPACAQCGCFAFSCFEDFAIRVYKLLAAAVNYTLVADENCTLGTRRIQKHKRTQDRLAGTFRVLALFAVGDVYVSLCKKALTLHLARGEGREHYFGCNLMQRKVLASSHQYFNGGSTRNSTQNSRSTFESRGRFTERGRTASCCRRATFSRASSRRALKAETRARTNDEIMPAWCRQTGD